MKRCLLLFIVCLVFSSLVKAQPYSCEDLGYVFNEGGCRDVTTMVRCPMDLSRVWCVGGEMCGLYPVKGEACNFGANIEECDLTLNMSQADKRCKYKEESCNTCWEKGVMTETCGTSEKCCKEGWDLINGKCIEHECSKIKYPYDTDTNTVADYAGEIEYCKSGNVIHFGYKSCSNMWDRVSDNDSEAGYYKCLCKRDDYENGYVFPYDKISFYTEFAQGKYGDNHMCADAENSYYGYTHCFRGYEMEKTDGKRNGKCKLYYSTYCQETSSVTNPLQYGDEPNRNAVINGGYKCVYDDICTEANQNYEECSVCKAADALNYEGKHYLKLCFRGVGTANGYIDYCPYENQVFIGNTLIKGTTPSDVGFDVRKNNWYGTCYRECTWGSVSCKVYDMVIKDSIPIGIVASVSGNNAYLVGYVQDEYKIFNGTNGGWDAAVLWASNFTPDESVCTEGSGCEVGRWQLPEVSMVNITGVQNLNHSAIIAYASSFLYGNKKITLPSDFWCSTEKGNTAYMRKRWESGYVDKNSALNIYAVPVIKMEMK